MKTFTLAKGQISSSVAADSAGLNVLLITAAGFHRVYAARIKNYIHGSLTSVKIKCKYGLPADVWWEARPSDLCSFLRRDIFSSVTPRGAQQGYSHTPIGPVWANDNQTAASPPSFYSARKSVFSSPDDRHLQDRFCPGFGRNADKAAMITVFGIMLMWYFKQGC